MAEHPLDAAWAALVRRFQTLYPPPYEAEVVAWNDADHSVDLKPADPSLGPGPSHVPVALIGCWAVKLAPGAVVLVEHKDGRRDKPFVRTVLSGTITEADIDATTIKIGPSMATAVLLGKGAQPVVALNDLTDPVVNGKPAKITSVVNTVVKV